MKRPALLLISCLVLALLTALSWRQSTERQDRRAEVTLRPPAGEVRDVVPDSEPAVETSRPDAPVKPAQVNPSARVSGRFVRFDGLPETRFDVIVEPLCDGPDDRLTLKPDYEGWFRFTAVNRGKWRVFLSGRGSPNRAVEIMVPAHGDLEGLEFRIPETWEFSVTLCNDAGTPLQDVLLLATGESKGLSEPDYSRTDSDGRAFFCMQEATEARIVMDDRFAEDQLLLMPRPVTIPRGTPTANLIAMSAGQATGKVLDPSGLPLHVGLVVLEDGEPVWEGYSDRADGSFKIRVPKDRTCTIAMLKKPHLEGELVGVSAGDLGLELRTKEIPKRRLQVHVRGPDGPIASAFIRIDTGAHDFNTMDSQADVDGNFVFEDAPRKAFKLRVWTFQQMDEPLWLSPEGVSVGKDDTSAVVELAAGVWISGEVLRENSAGPVRSFISIMAADRELVNSLQDDGNFRIAIPKDTLLPIRVRATSWLDETEYVGEAEIASPDQRFSITTTRVK